MLNEFFAQFAGRMIPGGCEDCDAEQWPRVEDETGIFVIEIRHDEDCPYLIARRASG